MPKITNLGHQTWCVHGDSGDILVDPVVTRTFGNDPELQFEVWPPREVDLDGLRDVQLVAITNEHLDHFHIPSLAVLRTFVDRVFVPPLFPREASNVIEQMGFDLMRGSIYTQDALALEFLSPRTSQVPVWESRCASLLVRDTERATSVLIQSDTLIEANAALNVDIFVATNNSQVRPHGWEGLGLTNMLDTQAGLLDHLRQLGSVYSEPLGGCRFVTFSGGGYRSIPRLHEPFLLADSTVVAQFLNESSVEDRFVGLLPGESLAPDGTVSTEPWVREATPLAAEPIACRHEEGAALRGLDLPALFPAEDNPGNLIHRLATSLAPLERFVAASEFGNALVDANVWMGHHRSADERFVIHTKLTQDVSAIATYDIGENTFMLRGYDGSLGALMHQYPFGMTLWGSDLLAVLDGRIQPWELLAVGARQWYPDDPFTSPGAFLYAALSETVAPDLAATVYRNVLETTRS